MYINLASIPTVNRDVVRIAAAEQPAMPAGVTKAIYAGDSFAVINTSSGRVIETSLVPDRAGDAARVLNEHEARNGRPQIYAVHQVV